jgi:uncharacterized protein
VKGPQPDASKIEFLFDQSAKVKEVGRAMSLPRSSRVVHLELHSPDLGAASAFYAQLLGWRTQRIDVRWGSYHALGLDGPLDGALDGGIVECAATHATWLPYVEVERIEAVTERGRRLGASVLLEPREGPAGWSSVLRSSVGGEIALWQPKQPLARGTGWAGR